MKILYIALALAGFCSLAMTASAAFADDPVRHGNPRVPPPDNPFAVAFTAGASVTGDKPEVCVALYKAPPAFGEELWNTPPAGGNPGWILQNRAGTPWTCSPHDPLE